MSRRNTHPSHNGRGYNRACPICNPYGWWMVVRARNRKSKAGKIGAVKH